MSYNKQQLAELVAAAKQRNAERLAAKQQSTAIPATMPASQLASVHLTGGAGTQGTTATLLDSATIKPTMTAALQGNLPATKFNGMGMKFNQEQSAAIELAVRGASFCLIGAAGTGKTTTTQEIVSRLQQCSHIHPIKEDTKMLSKGAPGIVIVGFTNKAVDNIRKKLPAHMQSHCMTIHKFIEFAPVEYEVIDENTGLSRMSMRFEPMRNSANPLPFISTVIIEEDSMVGVDLMELMLAAMPSYKHTQFIRLGDLNQLPPVFGPSDLGFSLTALQTIELVHVYRQALESPIISLATAIRTNSLKEIASDLSSENAIYRAMMGTCNEELVDDRGEHGKVTLRPWKKRVPKEQAVSYMKLWLPHAIDTDIYDPNEDQILCPFNVSFGTFELNRIIADHLAKKADAVVYEVMARYTKSYWAIGDRVMVDRQVATIIDIKPVIGYTGKLPQDPSKKLNRWGKNPDNPQLPVTGVEMLAELDKLETASDEDSKGKNSASHCIKVKFEDSEIVRELDTAGDINKMVFAYVLTVHKSQGSEWRRVFLLLHNSHSSMTSRELMYTAVTRAKEELFIFMEGDTGGVSGKANTIKQAANRPAIPGTTLQEKIEYFTQKMKEYVPGKQEEF